jgi:hypothetical protein
MAVYEWPANGGKAFWPRALVWGMMATTRAMGSPLSGSVQTLGMPGNRWRWTMTIDEQGYPERRALDGWLAALSGQEHRASLFDVVQPRPRGTCNLAGVTLAAPVAQFATSLPLAGCGAGRTLLAGDCVAVTLAGGSVQLLKVVADATADGAGAMTVQVRNRLRAAAAGGSAVAVDRPRGLFILAEPDVRVPYGANARCPSFTIDWVEVPE